MALQMDGAAGPSGLDSNSWKQILTSFKSHSTNLCHTLPTLAKCLCTSLVDPSSLSSFVACHLIALDKDPGVRPVGIGETVHRIICKAIVKTIRDDIQSAAGPLQVCAGHISGCEAATYMPCTNFMNLQIQKQLF